MDKPKFQPDHRRGAHWIQCQGSMPLSSRASVLLVLGKTTLLTSDRSCWELIITTTSHGTSRFVSERRFGMGCPSHLQVHAHLKMAGATHAETSFWHKPAGAVRSCCNFIDIAQRWHIHRHWKHKEIHKEVSKRKEEEEPEEVEVGGERDWNRNYEQKLRKRERERERERERMREKWEAQRKKKKKKKKKKTPDWICNTSERNM